MSGTASAQSKTPAIRNGARPGISRRGSVVVLASALAILAVAGCSRRPAALILASTTSTEDSGLFDVLLPAFEQAEPRFRIRLVAVGSGQALRLGERADADVLLVHSPAAEAEFMKRGYGEERRAVMYNDFVIVGPTTDPARIRGLAAVPAFQAIARSGAPFVSRGDDSGTHRKELALWKAAGITPAGAPWYVDVGQGMGETLGVAAERRAYVLSDRSTFLFMKQLGDLAILAEGDSTLFNPYSVIVVRRARNLAGARAFARWITSAAGQQVIGAYGKARFGRAFFTPSAAAGEPR